MNHYEQEAAKRMMAEDEEINEDIRNERSRRTPSPWTLPTHTGPKLDIKAKYNWSEFPYGEDDRDPAEIQQLQFEQMQQRWEFEREEEASKTVNDGI